MTRTLTRLLSQPAVFFLTYTVAAVLLTKTGAVQTLEAGLVVIPAVMVASYLVVTRWAWLPRPDRVAGMTRFNTIDDIAFKNDAKMVLSAVVPPVTLAPFLFLPISLYEPIGVDVVCAVLVGLYVGETWGVYRLTAQYLPAYAPHLFDEDYSPPVE